MIFDDTWVCSPPPSNLKPCQVISFVRLLWQKRINQFLSAKTPVAKPAGAMLPFETQLQYLVMLIGLHKVIGQTLSQAMFM